LTEWRSCGFPQRLELTDDAVIHTNTFYEEKWLQRVAFAGRESVFPDPCTGYYQKSIGFWSISAIIGLKRPRY